MPGLITLTVIVESDHKSVHWSDLGVLVGPSTVPRFDLGRGSDCYLCGSESLHLIDRFQCVDDSTSWF